MKTSTKWILGIVIGLVVVVAIAAIGFVVFNRFGGIGRVIDPDAIRRFGGERAFPGRRAHPAWVIPAFRFGGFPLLRILTTWLIWPGILVLIVLGVIALVRGISRSSQPAITSVPATPPAQAPAQASARTCSNCGRPVQDDWSHCPYCGHDLSDDLEGETPAV